MTVIEASNATEALRVLEENVHIAPRLLEIDDQ